MHNAYGLTSAEIDLLIKIADGFRDNIINTYKAKGLRQIEEGLTDNEYYDREMLDMMSVFNGKSDPFGYAITQTEYLKWIMGPVEREFGKDAIFDLLPDEAKTYDAVALYHKISEYGLSYLCEDAMKRAEQGDAENKPNTPKPHDRNFPG